MSEFLDILTTSEFLDNTSPVSSVEVVDYPVDEVSQPGVHPRVAGLGAPERLTLYSSLQIAETLRPRAELERLVLKFI